MFSSVSGWVGVDTSALHFQKFSHHKGIAWGKKMSFYAYRMRMWPTHWCQSHQRAKENLWLLENAVRLLRHRKPTKGWIRGSQNKFHQCWAETHLSSGINQPNIQDIGCSHRKQGQNFHDRKNGKKISEKVQN